MRPPDRQTTFGLLLIALASVLFTAPLVYVEYTNKRASEKTADVRQLIEQTWQSSRPVGEAREIDDSALLYVPAIGLWGIPILEGVDADSLAAGVGRFPGTARAGEPGNLALAGHRTAHGEPFADIDKLRPGDIVLIRTRNTIFRYRLLADTVVTPDQTWVLGDVSQRLGVDPNSALISLITCSPKWSTEKRWVWWGALIGAQET
jgi:sortase A